MIKFQNVTQRFADGTVALKDLSFTVEDGELVLITGPSGSGKTTVLNLLIKEYQPIAGEIFFDDLPLSKIKSNQLPLHRRKIGAVFQDYKLIEELNVWENIALPLLIQKENLLDIEERITDLLTLVELTDKALMFPKQLSGGEAQRISIARALATGPNVIFADEPTGNLDDRTSKHILDLLKKINQLGTTLIIATHDPIIIKETQSKRIDLTQPEAKSKKEADQPPVIQKKLNNSSETKKAKDQKKQDNKEKQSIKEGKTPEERTKTGKNNNQKIFQKFKKQLTQSKQQANALTQKLLKKKLKDDQSN